MTSVTIPPAGTAGFVTSDKDCHDGYRGGEYGISGKDAAFLSHQHTVAETSRGNQFNAKDRADQDRYLAREFCSLQVSGADRAASAQKDRADDSRWDCLKFDGLSKDVERNGRSAELATEKTGAAAILAIEKTAHAGQVLAMTNAAAAALTAAQNHAAQMMEMKECCCKQLEATREQGDITRALINQNERERLQARVVALERLLPAAI